MKGRVAFCIFFVLPLLLGSCNLSSENSALSPTTLAPVAEPSTTPVIPTDTAVPPTATSTPFRDPVLKVMGDEQVVYDWTYDRCRQENLADLASRAFRDATGQVQLILSHFISYRMVGPDLDHLTVDCNPIFTSHYDADPAMFDDNEWIAAPYTEDGQTIYALVHDEYEGHMHPGQCDVNYWNGPCWYGTLTLAISTDGGRSYQHIAPPPLNRFAGIPYRYVPGDGPEGIFSPSNIIKGQDGYYYNLGQVQYHGNLDQGVCLMRTDDLSDPGAWRFWDGQAFEGRFVDPYQEDIANPADYVCPPLAWDDIGASLVESLTYNTYLNRYVLVGVSTDYLYNRRVSGFYYSFSEDLIHWTHRKLLVEITLPFTAKSNTDVIYAYPSLIDPQSDTRNFETSGKTAYLYYTRQNFGPGSLDRDLVRVPVEFFPSALDVPDTPVSQGTPTAETVLINISKNGSFNVDKGTPVDLTMAWEAQTSQLVTDFMTAAQFQVQVDDMVQENNPNAWGEIMPNGDHQSSQWLFSLGVLDPGLHVIKIRVTLANAVSDGLGYQYSGTILNTTLQLTVGE